MFDIVLIGPSNAGKSSLAFEINTLFGHVHVNVGDLLRERSLQNDEIAYNIRCLLEEGSHVQNDIVLSIICEKLKYIGNGTNIILDGFPRNQSQTEIFEKICNISGKREFKALFINISEEESVNRAKGRIYCFNCKALYNEIYKPTLNNTCSLCGSKNLMKRNDDTEIITKTKYKKFLEHIPSVLEFFKKQGCLYTIDGNASIEDSMKTINNIITS